MTHAPTSIGEYYNATVSALNRDGTINLEYDDGAFWDHAPVSVLCKC